MTGVVVVTGATVDAELLRLIKTETRVIIIDAAAVRQPQQYSDDLLESLFADRLPGLTIKYSAPHELGDLPSLPLLPKEKPVDRLQHNLAAVRKLPSGHHFDKPVRNNAKQRPTGGRKHHR